MMKIKHYNDYSISEERVKLYLKMPQEKRLEWLYLGNLLYKAFCEMMEKEPLSARFRLKACSRRLGSVGRRS